MNIIAIDFTDSMLDDFIDLPWSLHDNKSWVPPLKEMIKQELSPENLFFRHGRAQYFVAMEGNRCVGRICASVDDLLVPQSERKVGHFGFFECIEDGAIAAALLESAEAWLAEQGCQEVHGPINFTIFNGYRVQTKGFDLTPFYGEPRSKSYYATLFQQSGYDVHYRWGSWDLNHEQIEQITAEASATESDMLGGREADYHWREANMDEFESELDRLYPVALKAYANNYGFSVIPMEEFLTHFVPYKSMVPSECFLLAEHQQLGLVGFYYGYPDYAPAFQDMDGDANQAEILLNYQPDRTIAYNIGVIEAVRKSAVPYSAFKTIFRRGLTHPRGIIGAMAKQGRCVYTKVGEPDREYAIVCKRI